MRLWCDNGAGIVRRGRLDEPDTGSVGTLVSLLVQMKPCDPNPRGRRTTSFLPGRSFTSPQGFNDELEQWLPPPMRALDGRAPDLPDPGRAHTLALPPVPPIVQSLTSVRLDMTTTCGWRH